MSQLLKMRLHLGFSIYTVNLICPEGPCNMGGMDSNSLKRIEDRRATVKKIDDKIAGVDNQLRVLSLAREKYVAEREAKAESLARMEELAGGVMSGDLQAELDQLNKRRLDIIIANKWMPGDPVETNLEKGEEFQAIISRIEEIQRVISGLDAELNRIYYGKA